MLICIPAWAWTPQRPINVYIGYGAGSTNETVFRKLTEVVVENNPDVKFLIQPRPGADGVIAQNHLATQPHDGYHISVPSVVSLFVANDIWQRDIKNYQWNQFVNLAIMGETPSAIIAPADSPVNSPRDLVAFMQKPDRPVNVAISGGTGRIAYEYFMHVIGGDSQLVKHVNFQNAGQTVLAVGGRQVDLSFVPVAAARSAVESGRVKIVALTGDQRLPMLPDVPSLHDVLPGFAIYSGWMITLPQGTDAGVISWYQKEFARAVRSDKYQRWAEQNLILINGRRLDPTSVRAYGERLRRDLLPATKNIKTE